MTTQREALINELAYVVGGKTNAERLVFEMMAEDVQKRLTEMTKDGASFDAFREHLRTVDIGHAPRTWFLLANVLSERDHRLAEKIRARADERERVLGRVLETSAVERSVADMIDPKKA